MVGGDDVLGTLLDASHLLTPDELAPVVARHAAGLGASEAVVYLADYEQRSLVPLPGEGVPEREPLDIDATIAGRAYRTVTPTDANGADGVRLWVPILNGTARLGVLELGFDEVGFERERRARRFAGLVAELIVSRDLYGDALIRSRRSRGMSLAAEMQWDLLPPQTFGDGRLTLAGILEPAYDVAGDSFDYALNGDILSFAIIDAMGHGFEATLLSSVAVGSYRHSRRAGVGLAETYAAMDRIIAERFGPDRFLTLQLGELDVASGELRWLNAGHPAPLLARGGRVVGSLDCEPTLPVGFGGAIAEIAEERLEPADHLLFYTDGVVEARSGVGEFFGDARLADLLGRALTAGLPAPETVRRLAHAILEHQGSDLQDDATTMLLNWHGSG